MIADDQQQRLFSQQQSAHRQDLLAASQRRGEPYTSVRPLPRGLGELNGYIAGDAIGGVEYGMGGEYDLGLRSPRGAAVNGEATRPVRRAPLSALNNVRPFCIRNSEEEAFEVSLRMAHYRGRSLPSCTLCKLIKGKKQISGSRTVSRQNFLHRRC